MSGMIVITLHKHVHHTRSKYKSSSKTSFLKYETFTQMWQKLISVHEENPIESVCASKQDVLS
jgi:hypothetical protein